MNLTKQIAFNGVLIGIIAHGLIGISLVWDKVLLQKRETQNLVSYVFWLGAISIFGLILIPFGFKLQRLEVAGLGFTAGLLDLIASYFYYWALKSGEASDELAAIGGFAPVATALIAMPLLKTPLGDQFTGFIVLTAGGFVMFFAERKPLKKILPKIAIASAAFGLTNVLQKIVFNQANFVTGYVFFTLGTFIGSVSLLIPPSWRRQIFEHSGGGEPRNKFWYLVNRLVAGVGSFLVVFAISRANPAVVEAISGVRYAVIFVGAYWITKWKPTWFREDFRTWVLIAKVIATSLVIGGLVLIGLSGGHNGTSGPRVNSASPNLHGQSIYFASRTLDLGRERIVGLQSGDFTRCLLAPRRHHAEQNESSESKNVRQAGRNYRCRPVSAADGPRRRRIAEDDLSFRRPHARWMESNREQRHFPF